MADIDELFISEPPPPPLDLFPALPSAEEEVLAAGYILDTLGGPGSSSSSLMGGPARAWGKMPLTIDNASQAEQTAGAKSGTYYVASAKQKLVELSQIHNKWFCKSKNRASSYAAVQKEIEDFYLSCQRAFDERFKSYLIQPGFEVLGAQKRQRNPKK
jgi:hypothetical protein